MISARHPFFEAAKETFWIVLVPVLIVANLAWMLHQIEIYWQHQPIALAATLSDSIESLAVSTPNQDYQAVKSGQNFQLVNIAPKGRFTFTVSFKNIGKKSWYNNGPQQMRLRLKNTTSSLRDPFWRDSRTPAFLKEKEIKPGETGNFIFAIQAPTQGGQYPEDFWLMTKDGQVVSGSETTIQYNVGTFSFHFRSELVEQDYQTINIEPGRGFTFRAVLKNLGPNSWENSGKNTVTLVTNNKNGAISPFRHQFWPEATVVARMKEKLVKPGQIATFEFALQAPLEHGTYRENFYLKAEGPGLMRGGHVQAQINVKKEVVNVVTGQPTLMIGLYRTDKALEITADNDYQIVDEGGVELDAVSANNMSTVAFDGTVFTINTSNKTSTSNKDVKFVSKDPNSVFKLVNYENKPSWNQNLNDNVFRGAIHFKYNDKNKELWVINELPLELYLRGVAEAGNENDPDYLKALIIAARTYAQYHVLHPGKHADQEFLLGTTEGDQVYRGYGFELRAPNINTAVRDTEGVMVAYENEVVVTPYFSQTDGRTRAWEEVWSGEAKGWLKSVEDPCCAGLPLQGHGVGMSAKGARYFAEEKDWSYEQILKYYFTGVEMKKLY